MLPSFLLILIRQKKNLFKVSPNKMILKEYNFKYIT